MNRDFLSTPQFTKKNILENVFAPNGFNGERAQADVDAVAREIEQREFSGRLLYLSSGLLLLSLYNVTRLSVLSGSGRTAALAGTAFFSFLNYACYSRMGCNCLREQKPETSSAS